MDTDEVEYLRTVDATCTRCGICTEVHLQFGQTPLTFGDVAGRVVQAVDAAAQQGRPLQPFDVPDDICGFARSCLTCGRCTADCPVGIRAATAIMAVRSFLAQAMPGLAGEYRRYRCDLADSMYSRMRRVTGGGYDEFLPRSLATGTGAQQHDAATDAAPDDGPAAGHVLFFPGCTLANNFPALARHTFERLQADGLADCITAYCCGHPLGLIGLSQNRGAYGRRLAARLRAKGVRKIITACPNCYYELRPLLVDQGLGDSIELEFLAHTLADAGYRFEPSEQHPFGSVAFHDSCPDRHDGIVASGMRRLFQNVEVIEPASSQLHSVCCGSGGFASIYNPDICQNFFGQGIVDFFGTHARCLVSGCATCARTYKASGAVRAAHYLELIFDVEMDMQAYDKALEVLWDAQGPDNLESFADDAPLFLD